MYVSIWQGSLQIPNVNIFLEKTKYYLGGIIKGPD